MKHIPLFIVAIGVLSACSTVVNNQTQHIAVKTPGASNARCLIENEDMKYSVFTDQKIEIMKSPHDFTVRCQAEGNREQTVLVKREIDEWVVANVANGFVPGAAYDYFSRGAFSYPETITVSFVGDPVKPYPLPKYMQKDVMPNAQNSQIEYMGPGTMITEENKHYKPSTLEKKQNSFVTTPSADVKVNARPTNLRSRNVSTSYDPTEEDK